MEAIENKLTIISRSDRPFKDRAEAGGQLAVSLSRFKGPQTVILGIPTGGVVVASRAAWTIGVPLDIVLSRKLGAPDNQELAVGAVSENGEVYIDLALAKRVGADEQYLFKERESELNEIGRRQEVYRKVCSKIDLKNKDVIVVDDGIATGSTVMAALWTVARENPRKIIGAFPVAPEETLRKLCEAADEIICLRVPSFLGGVGKFYLDFTPVSQGEVLTILKDQDRRAYDRS